MRMGLYLIVIHIYNVCVYRFLSFSLLEVMRFFVFLENRLCARVLDIGGIGGIGDIGGIEGKRGKGDRRDFRKRHQSFARTLTWCPAVCVTESNGPSPSPSSAALQCM